MSTEGGINWINEIVLKSKVDRDEVVRILAAHGVEEDSTLPRKRSVTLKKVLLRGKKYNEDKPFEFQWDDLGKGIWSLLTDANSKGKSSILGLIRGALRGDLPGNRLKSDIWGWLSEFELDFLIDEHRHRVRLTKMVGAPAAANADVSLSRFDGDREVIIRRGANDDGFGKAIDSLFMDELGFSRVRAYRSKEGEAVEHGWPSMCASLFITGPNSILFGDTGQDGVNLRLIQLFIGLPWVTTYTCASTSQKAVAARLAKENSNKDDRITGRIKDHEGKVAQLEAKLSAEPDLSALRAELPLLDRELVQKRQAADAASALVSSRETLFDDAKFARAEARRKLLQSKDDAEAKLVFKRLKPTCCPSCARAFGNDRFVASESLVCGLCGNEEEENGSSEALINGLEADAAETLKVQKAALKALEAAKDAAKNATGAVATLVSQIDEVQAKLHRGSASDDIRLEIATLKARIEELKFTAGPVVDLAPIQQELAVLSAAEKVTKSLFNDLQTAILDDVSKALMKFSTAFGVKNLQSMALNGAGQIKIEQGGQTTSFMKLNPGENLRVRIAAALAVLDVAERRGHGRHPGLIILDSPAAQEMSSQDFAALVESVVAAVDEFPNVQILIGAVNREELLSHVPVERRRHAAGETPLF
ncbi:hypothetical protein [Novosphingobium kaempferiae]|uniref:hypothetical protein n=1 Tax=Novosphingobium kaempferiae TaxID=2896849 RepID=UPI001E37DE8C|nr:hypothetical protein [Novosphingobium kaempferiae]